MSLILEALRKSEAERQLGKVPGLTTAMPVRPGGEQRSPLFVPGMTLLLVAGVIATIWWYSARQSAPESMSSPEIPVSRSDSQVATTSGGAIDVPAKEREATHDARVEPPSVIAARTKNAAANNDAGAPVVEQPAPISAPASAAAPTSPEVPRDPMFDSIEREARAMVATEARVPGASAPAGIETPSIVAPDSRTPPVTAGDLETLLEQVVRLDQLPLDVRNALPPLKLSMHVYVEDSGSRFVLIDGRRYAQGEAISDALHVVEIRRDGALLDFNGRRFLLRRP